MSNLSRQDSLVQFPTPPTIHIIGCGGVGSWIALWLGKALPEAIFHLWDGDYVDGSNLHRTPYNVNHVGHPKTHALLALLMEAGRNNRPWTHGPWTEGLAQLIEAGSIVVAAIDSMAVRRTIYAHAQKVGATYWDVGAEESGCNVSDSPADFDIAGADAQRGYFTPVFIGPVAVAAAVCTWAILRGLDVRDFRMEDRDGQFRGGFNEQTKA